MAADGEEALDLSRRYIGEIHLLLSDVTMPRMNGFRLAEAIREERPSTRALLISGRISSEILAGNALFDFLHKPFVPEQLKTKLRQILARRPDGVEEM
jgi:YesN/AraC family two-component response regulator